MKRLLSVLLFVVSVVPMLAAEKDAKIYELRVYWAAEGKLDALHARFKDQSLKLLEKHGITTLGVWVPLENPDRRIVHLVSHKDAVSAAENWKAFADDPELKKLIAAGKGGGSTVEKQASFYLNATDFSPALAAKDGGKERVFELRTYITTPKNLDAIQSRFRDHTVKLFEKHGMTNVVYWTLADDKPTVGPLLEALAAKGAEKSDAKAEEAAKPAALVYIISHASTDAAKKSFTAFRDDPAWKTALSESEKKAGGSLTVKNGVKSLMLKATHYSPLK